MSSNLRGPALGCLISLGVVVVGFLGLIVLILGMAFSSGSSEEAVYGDRIAHIDIEGMISASGESSWAGASSSMVDRISKQLKRAKEDKDVKAVVLRINSPGGEVTAADTLYHQVSLLAKEKPVLVYMDSVAASGGYYIACAADEIFANQTTLTGSIGVIISTMNYEDLFGKVGLRSMVFTSGKFKDTLSGNRTMREDEKALVQDLVSQIYERFLEVVMESRTEIPEAKLRSSIADGRIFTGSDATAKGLIDGTCYIEDVYDRAREVGNAPDAKVVKYTEEASFFDALGLMKSHAGAGANRTRIEVHLPETLVPQMKPGLVYLLPSFYAN